MDDIGAALRSIGDALRDALAGVFDGGAAAADDAELLAVVGAAAEVIRKAEGVLVAVTAEVQERSAGAVRDDRLTTRFGCRSVSELLQRATRFSPARVADVERAARGIWPVGLTGEMGECVFPSLRAAMRDGVVGSDAAAAAMAPLQAAAGRVGRSELCAADSELADAACGRGVDSAPPATAAELRVFAQVWATYLDQDGAEPREERALRNRGLVLGRERDGLIPVRGALMPEVAGQLQRIFHSILNPKLAPGVRFSPEVWGNEDPGEGEAAGEGEGREGEGREGEGREPSPDVRTRPQKQHDALATALVAAAASGGLPAIGGAAPTLVVTVRAADLASGRGYARVSGCDVPVPASVAAHTACIGDVQRVVLGREGRIVSLGFAGRIFTAHQRRAILARDGGCLIPGCDTPPEWCEIHHVEEASRGGPTHTDNGVALCWHHHRTLDGSGWQVRMRRGVPEVRGPAWWDPLQRWRRGGRPLARVPA
ncbi:DUF222 domain-containing protein [Microbacterium caowuchunii]|uniref:HNH endonuclease signature motif containing protein n=1 Tax=Microbacterium caowuchunii TaxID=2614638 RepID=UPI0012448356|nr:HNH endonuclease signature motif containing protein [Microbacterium caowuchunii]QEV99469.1 DUF222 domain-containing protein [Microbacterium caowuchunii]